MASAAPLGKALEEATCSICLEYLTEPVTIHCGHNFCRGCIIQYSEQGEYESSTKVPCPQCRAPFQKWKLRPNRQLSNIVESIKQCKMQPGEAQKENLCERHQEKLQVFCEEDGEVICVVCRESWAHRAHTVLPIEEAAQDYKVKLQEALGSLREELEDTVVMTSEEENKTMKWREKVKHQRQSITCEFKKLHQFLSEEEQLLLHRLAKEEKETLQRLEDNIKKLSEQNKALISLITEMEKKCQQSAAGLLQDVKSTLIRSENAMLQQPEPISLALRNVYSISLDMRERLERFNVDVTLDPDTVHPRLVRSKVQKHVTLNDSHRDLPDNPERIDGVFCVMGTEGFTGGRRYWEVQVGEKTRWILGVCRESVSRKGTIGLAPEHGYWVMRLRNGRYQACTSPLVTLSGSKRLSQVGIFLDYEAGNVSFYNVTDRSHLFTFTDTFSGLIYPYFNPCLKPQARRVDPLITSPVPDEDRGDSCSLQ